MSPLSVSDGSMSRDVGELVFPLSRLRELYNPALQSVQAQTIKHSATPATVYRLLLDYGPDASAYPATLIAKRVAPNWGEDSLGYRREGEFYSRWAAPLGAVVPRVYFAGPEPDTDHWLVLMEDVSASYQFATPDQAWRPDELHRAMRTYANLHVSGQTITSNEQMPDWLFPRYEQRVMDRAADLPGMIDMLFELGALRPIRGFDALLERVIDDITAFAGLPTTLLHNDVAPQNIGLRQPTAPETNPDVILVDWEMVGTGLAEMDLTYMFMQPFGNTKHLDRDPFLDTYWAERQRLEGHVPSAETRRAIQRHADAVFALWLVPVACERARNPFPPGSAPRVYWDSMLPILEERLVALTAL